MFCSLFSHAALADDLIPESEEDLEPIDLVMQQISNQRTLDPKLRLQIKAEIKSTDKIKGPFILKAFIKREEAQIQLQAFGQDERSSPPNSCAEEIKKMGT